MTEESFFVDHRKNKNEPFYLSTGQKLSKKKFLVIASDEPNTENFRNNQPKKLAFVSMFSVCSIADFSGETRKIKKRFIYETDVDAESALSASAIADEIKRAHNFDAVFPGIESEKESTSFADFREILISLNDTTAVNRARFAKDYDLLLIDYDKRGNIGLYRANFHAIPEIFSRLNDDTRVSYAEPNYLGTNDDAEHTAFNHSDLETDILFKDYWAHKLTHLTEQPNATYGNEVTIAVIDSRIDVLHEDIRDSILSNSSELDFCPGHVNTYIENHGTQSASVALSRKKIHDDSFLGIAPKTRLLPMSVVLGNSDGLLSRIKAINLCADIANNKRYKDSNNGMRIPVPRLVVNCSWQVSIRPIPISFQEAFSKLLDSDAVVVCSSGNDKKRNEPHFPSDYPGAISVAAVKEGDLISAYSNINREVTICAPGGEITNGNKHGGVITAINGGGYIYSEGTSFAAPYVSGMAAALWSMIPGLNAKAVRKLLIEQCAVNILNNNQEVSNLLNAGRVDAERVSLAVRHYFM